MVAPGRRGENRSTRTVRSAFASSTPLIALGLAVVVVVGLNMRHLTTLCDSDSEQDEAMNRAAMERRIRTLENEILENGVLMTKLLRGLDEAFHASSLLSVYELKLLALREAADIGERRARQPPPPMSDYARARVAQAVGGDKLQDLIAASILPDTSLLSGFESTSSVGNQGWDWGPQPSFEDDFLGSEKVASYALPKWDVTDKEREALCRGWLVEYGVTPGADWGTLPVKEKEKWIYYRCDEMESIAGAVTTFGGTRSPPKKKGAGEAEEANGAGVKRRDSEESESLAGDEGNAVEHRDGWDSGDVEAEDGGGGREGGGGKDLDARRLQARVEKGREAGGGRDGDWNAAENGRRTR